MTVKRQKRVHPGELTDRIKALRARFERYRHSGIQANPDGVAALIGELDAILEQAEEFRNELSALRWNWQGRIDIADETTQALLANLADPASNVVALARMQVPFSDGHPNGGDPA